MVNTSDDDPARRITFDENFKLVEYDFKNWGGVEYNWWVKGLEEYWEYITNNKLTAYRGTKLNLNFTTKSEGKKHKEILEMAAAAGWGLNKHELTIEQFKQLLAEEAGQQTETKEEKAEKISVFKMLCH